MFAKKSGLGERFQHHCMMVIQAANAGEEKKWQRSSQGIFNAFNCPLEEKTRSTPTGLNLLVKYDALILCLLILSLSWD